MSNVITGQTLTQEPLGKLYASVLYLNAATIASVLIESFSYLTSILHLGVGMNCMLCSVRMTTRIRAHGMALHALLPKKTEVTPSCLFGICLLRIDGGNHCYRLPLTLCSL